MAKFKIQKGLTDADMMKNFKEEVSFENTMLTREAEAKKTVIHKGNSQDLSLIHI